MCSIMFYYFQFNSLDYDHFFSKHCNLKFVASILDSIEVVINLMSILQHVTLCKPYKIYCCMKERNTYPRSKLTLIEVNSFKKRESFL